MATILVTGGAGYIGSHACKALARAGHTPVTLDNLSAGHADAVRWGPLEQADIRDTPALRALLAKHRPHAVMHFAARASVGESVRDPALYHSNNVEGTRSLLEAMQAEAVSMLIFSSTCAVHGIPAATPIREDAPIAPINPYGETKALMERAIAASGLRYAILRYFNAAGADPEGELTERHQPETHVIPLALKAAREGAAFPLYGTDYETPDGTPVRDYIHVTDLAEAHVRALTHLQKGGESCILNLGTGRGVSVRELITAIERVTGKKLTLKSSPRREGDAPILVADPTRAREILGFEPKLSNLETILRTAHHRHPRA